MKYSFLKQRTENQFEAKKPLMSENEAIVESSRCIRCFGAPCIQGCPTTINIPQFIKRIEDKNFFGAADTILQSNLLGLSCSKVCPVETLCEGACVYNEMDEPPIQIGRLQEYALHHFYQAPNLKPLAKNQQKKVALIGAGPASLSCAGYLALSGIQAVIFEKENLPGGLNSLGVAPYKFKLEESIKEVEFIQSLGVEIQTNKQIGRDVTSDDLLKEYDAIFIGVGLAEDTFALDTVGLTNVMGALDLIREIKTKLMTNIKQVKQAIVIGGGNTALDVAQELAGLGIQTHLAYRKNKIQMSGYQHELDQAVLKGVIFLENHTPKKIIKQNHLATAVEFETEQGMIKLACDFVAFATGQSKHLIQELFPTMKINPNKNIIVNDFFETSIPNIYAGGDCVNGGKEVVNAVHDGRQAAYNILKKLKQEVKYGKFSN